MRIEFYRDNINYAWILLIGGLRVAWIRKHQTLRQAEFRKLYPRWEILIMNYNGVREIALGRLIVWWYKK